MSIRCMVLLAGRKCMKVLRHLRLRRERRVHQSPRLEKLQQGDASNATTRQNSSDKLVRCDENINLVSFPQSSPSTTTPPFPVENIRTPSNRTPSFYENIRTQNTTPSLFCENNRTPKFIIHSIYENINCSYDSAYDSEGIDFIDSEENEVNISVLENSSNLRRNVGPWVENSAGEKENFENMWNETIEILVTLS